MATRNCANCTYAEVNAAVNGAAGGSDPSWTNNPAPAGTIVQLPTGSPPAWTNTLNITRDVSVLGSGIGTVITAGVTPLFHMTRSSGDNQRVGKMKLILGNNLGFRVDGGTGAGADSAIHGTRIDHIFFFSGPRLYDINGQATGVMDHCCMNLLSSADNYVNQETWAGGRFGDGSWSQPLNLPTTASPNKWGFWFQEDNVNIQDTGSADGKGGCREVFRHNTDYGNIGGHGSLDSSSNFRGTIFKEISNNLIIRTSPKEVNGTGADSVSGKTSAMNVRGGTWRVFNNYMDESTLAFNPWIAVHSGLLGLSNPSWTDPGGGADGLNRWHHNVTGPIESPPGSGHIINPVTISGTGTGGVGSVYADIAYAGPNLGSASNNYLGPITVNIPGTHVANCFKYFTLVNLARRGAVGTYHAVIGSNTAGTGTITITTVGTAYGATGTSASAGLYYQTNDHLYITKVDSCLDGPGKGPGDLVLRASSGGNPLNPRWLNEATAGIVYWNNKIRNGAAGTEPIFSDGPIDTSEYVTIASRGLDFPFGEGFSGLSGSLAQCRLGRDVCNVRPGTTGVADIDALGDYNWQAGTQSYVGADEEVRQFGYNLQYPARITTVGTGGAPYPHFLVAPTAATPNIISGSTTTFATDATSEPQFQFQSSGFTAAPTWTITAGSLPSGVTLTTGGLLHGFPPTPTQDYVVTVEARYAPTTPDEVDSIQFTLKVQAPNVIPICSLTAPPDGTVVTGATVVLGATASSSTSTIAFVNFYRGGSTLINPTPITSTPYGYTWTGVAPGTYVITAKATDNAGGVSLASNSATITVGGTAPTPPPPTIVVSA